ncbi:cytochrome P450 [Patulibacter sp.]|uniref:cytochrome P450 n=1 Tax=Patulibacter sp. TaxID=1912859 RepID=UPI00271D0FAA|nr:cytochrome P450 [Patulibacter sp.]MDO9408329.1 cytochrome P450 [Patulibacter sp.]
MNVPAAPFSFPAGPRGPMPWHAAQFARDTWGFLASCTERFGETFTLDLPGGGKWVFLTNPEHVKQVYTGDPGVFHAGEGNSILLPLLGKHSVLLLDEKPHLRQRKLLLPPFHGKRMAGYEDLMRSIARDTIDAWPTGTPLKAWPQMQAITLEIIMRAVFGVAEGARLDRLREALETLMAEVTKPRTMMLIALMGEQRFARLPAVQRRLRAVDDVLLPEIAARRQVADLDERTDILSMLLQARDEDGELMGDRELRDELMTLLVAGHETTATSLSWALEKLVRHPDALRRLQDEVREGESDVWMTAVIRETMRLCPVISITVRELQEPVQIAGHRLPAGARVVPCIHLVHRRPDLYPDPDAFRPERWLDQTPGTYTWIPFGGGVRRCLGASFALFEMKVILGEIVRSMDLQTTTAPGERMRTRAITRTPGGQAEIVVARRPEVVAEQPVAVAAG